MPTYCGLCHNECDTKDQDDSFDHEFGTEHIHNDVSDCCEDEVLVKNPRACFDCDHIKFRKEDACFRCAMADQMQNLAEEIKRDITAANGTTTPRLRMMTKKYNLVSAAFDYYCVKGDEFKNGNEYE